MDKKLKKTTQFKNMLLSSELEFIMEAHNGLSAKIVEETGFKGIWASGLSLSAALGVRDNNEASWTQVLDVLEFMSDNTSIPILLDGDTGYGNFNNFRRLVKKLEQRQIAAVCIEDKLFPKTNSFIGGETQPLADIDEFCGKIKSGKDTQENPDFCVVARTEAFIAGWGLKEAIRRAEAYRVAGADAILVHSQKATDLDIEQFMKEWANRHPIVIVPTKYFSVPTDKFRSMDISMVIWANHNMRAAVTAMKKMSKQIFEEQTLINVEHTCASVSEVFRLQGADELQDAEKKYLPTSGKQVNAIVLAASQGSLGDLTKDIPKTLIKIKDQTILSSIVENFNTVGIKDISVVRGFQKDKVNLSNVKKIDNNDYASTKELYSLYLAKDQFQDNTVISYGDILFRNYILNDLLNDENDITLMVDADAQLDGEDKDFVSTSKPYSREIYLSSDRGIELKNVSSSMKGKEINGEFIGLWKVNKKGALIVKSTLEKLSSHPNFKKMNCGDLFNEIVKEHKIAVKYIRGSWIDIDNLKDLLKAGEF